MSFDGLEDGWVIHRCWDIRVQLTLWSCERLSADVGIDYVSPDFSVGMSSWNSLERAVGKCSCLLDKRKRDMLVVGSEERTYSFTATVKRVALLLSRNTLSCITDDDQKVFWGIARISEARKEGTCEVYIHEGWGVVKDAQSRKCKSDAPSLRRLKCCSSCWETTVSPQALERT